MCCGWRQWTWKYFVTDHPNDGHSNATDQKMAHSRHYATKIWFYVGQYTVDYQNVLIYPFSLCLSWYIVPRNMVSLNLLHKQVTFGYNIAMGGWAGAYNPHLTPLPIHTIFFTLASPADQWTTDYWTDGPQPKWSRDLKYSPCPPTCDRGSRVSCFVFIW